jgi:putative flavoprotein involved in K+ transport
MKHVTTVIIGAGQSGLAFSKHLSGRGIDHVLLERGRVGHSWRTERWDTLRLLTPNWQSRLPGYRYTGNDPDGYMDMRQVVDFLQGYADFTGAPVEEETTVVSVRPIDGGYDVVTDRGTWRCRSLMIASGACNVALRPRAAEGLPSSIRGITPMEYRNPDALEEGGVMVVGASATGVQLASEIQASGRPVTLAAGEHVRVPRMYRGRDVKWWMDVTGVMDTFYTEADDITRARRVPSLQLVGSPERRMLDLNALQDQGVEVVGRLTGIDNGRAIFSGALANQCTLADLKMNRLLDGFDDWSLRSGMDGTVGRAQRFEPTRIAPEPKLAMDLAQAGIRSVIWATGYRPDYSWLEVPVLDRKGRIRHDGGVVDAPGMYVLGLPFLRRRKSSFIDGANDDARDLADHLHAALSSKAA